MSGSSPLREMQQAACDIIPVLNRFLGSAWNILMKLFCLIGLMPLLKRRPWLLAALIFLLMALFPPVGIPLFAVSLIALHSGVRADEGFMVLRRTTEVHQWTPEEQREALQAEAMLVAYENGASADDLSKIGDAVGKLFDAKSKTDTDANPSR